MVLHFLGCGQKTYPSLILTTYSVYMYTCVRACEVCDHGIYFAYLPACIYVLIFLQFEHSVAANVCRAVLESYNMSFRDCLQVVHTKVEFMNSIIVKLGGSEKLPVDP